MQRSQSKELRFWVKSRKRTGCEWPWIPSEGLWNHWRRWGQVWRVTSSVLGRWIWLQRTVGNRWTKTTGDASERGGSAWSADPDTARLVRQGTPELQGMSCWLLWEGRLCLSPWRWKYEPDRKAARSFFSSPTPRTGHRTASRWQNFFWEGLCKDLRNWVKCD